MAEIYRVRIRGTRPLLMHAPVDLGNYPSRRRGEHLPPKEEAEMRLYKDEEEPRHAKPRLAGPGHAWPCPAAPCQAMPSHGMACQALSRYQENLTNINFNIKAMLRDAGRNYRVRGRRTTFGAIIRAAIEIRPFMVPLKHDGWVVDIRPVVVQRQRILRARPRFDNWELEFEIINKDPDMIPADMVKRILIDAGKYYGLCDFRPEFGLFEVVEFEKVKEAQD